VHPSVILICSARAVSRRRYFPVSSRISPKCLTSPLPLPVRRRWVPSVQPPCHRAHLLLEPWGPAHRKSSGRCPTLKHRCAIRARPTGASSSPGCPGHRPVRPPHPRALAHARAPLRMPNRRWRPTVQVSTAGSPPP
jgi:hypothetical protein